ncbi:lipopolysaccharide biosynthesis protein [Qipengyuania aquimaris]|uniref:Lipopolysaccharide biosynthesis protein n=1 Tax=Qipengyuania aquimaris TaxID=255984 RepID=A0A9Q3S152_9SPHN|nr:lipopolysaccharide biosynthesis protein [Qipengyuania aquimaris]MBY6217890.1 lipopolysaccharide biosynthesis protein [Qipengyuania aquimaris]
MNNRNTYLLTADLLNDIERRTANGTLISGIGQASFILINLAQIIVLSRLLKPEDFGLIALASTITLFAGIFKDLGLTVATVQAKELDQPTVSAIFFLNLIVGATATILCWASVPIIALLFEDDRIPSIIIAMSLSIFVSCVGGQHQALLQRRMRWVRLQIVRIVPLFFGFSVSVLCSLLLGEPIKYWALVFGNWASTLLGTMLLWALCSWRPSLPIRLRDAGPALSFGINLSIFNIVNFFHRQFDNLLLGWRWGVVELGFYSRAYTLLNLPISMINEPIGSAVRPALCRLQNEAAWSATYLKWLGLVSFVTALAVSLMAINASLVVEIILGPQWVESGLIFSVLLIGAPALAVTNTSGWIYISLAQTDRMFRWSVVGVSMYVAAFLFGLPYGALGVAYAYAIASWLWLPLCIFASTRRAEVSFSQVLFTTAPTTISSGLVAMVAPTLSMPKIGTVLWFAYSGLIVLTLVLCWLLSPNRFRIGDILKSLPRREHPRDGSI